jgi:hypothetical protein
MVVITIIINDRCTLVSLSLSRVVRSSILVEALTTTPRVSPHSSGNNRYHHGFNGLQWLAVARLLLPTSAAFVSLGLYKSRD